jgi:DNA-binding NtrC family response regulator
MDLHLRQRLGGLLKREPKVKTPRTVLLVDANQAERQGTRKRLATLGYVVLEAGQLADALQQLESQDPDFVFLAADLPDAEGLEGLKRIRELGPELQVIVLLRDYHDARAAQAMRLGALAYLARPFGTDDLREVLARR